MFTCGRGGGAFEKPDVVSINENVAINRALNDFLAFMVDFPDTALSGIFLGLVAFGGCVDLGLQLFPFGIHRFQRALLGGLFARLATANAVHISASGSSAGQQRADQRGLGPANHASRSEERRVGKEGVSTCRSQW